MRRIFILLVTLLLCIVFNQKASAISVSPQDTVSQTSRMTLMQKQRARMDSLDRIDRERQIREQAFRDSLLKRYEIEDSLSREADRIKAIEDSVKSSFNALNYLQQKRYRPKDDTFVSEKFLDNTFLYFKVGGFGLFPIADQTFGVGPGLDLGFGKWINARNAVRANVGVGSFYRNFDNQPSITAGMSIFHMFNLMAFIGGYSEHRLFELSTIEGVGIDYSQINNERALSLGLNMGLNLKFRLTSALDIFAEPLFTLYSDNIDISNKRNWHGYDLGYRYSVGLSYKFCQSNISTSRINFDKLRLFMFYGAGVQVQNSDFVRNDIGILKSLGPSLYTGLGRWWTDYLAFRGTIFYGEDKWKLRKEDQQLLKSQYVGARLELMLDFVQLLTQDEDDHFSSILVVGPEFGYIRKDDNPYQKISRYYTGLSTGVQFKYKANKKIGVYIEPHCSIVPYSVGNIEAGNLWVRKNYYDAIINLNLGVEYNLW